MGARTWLLAMACAASAFIGSDAWAQAPRVKSGDQKLQAVIVPDRNWCADVVNVELRGTTASFRDDPAAVQRFIGATRAGILEDCAQAEIIRIRGVDGSRSAFLAFTAAAINWRIRVVDAADGVLPMLKPSTTDDDASLRELAYFVARSMLRRAELQDVVYSGVMQAGREDHVTWRVANISGNLNVILDRARDYPEVRDFADAVANQTSLNCTNSSGQIGNVGVAESPPLIWVRGFQCDFEKEGYVQYFVFTTEGPYTFVMSLYSTDRDRNIPTVVEAILKALRRPM